jgi:metal-responsive CopG/Arc/MetJ family transcriptional regulator
MRVKISITLTEEALRAIDQRTNRQGTTRSDFIEAPVRAFVGRPAQPEQNARDLDILNRRADFLNQEARDVLEYQALP